MAVLTCTLSVPRQSYVDIASHRWRARPRQEANTHIHGWVGHHALRSLVLGR